MGLFSDIREQQIYRESGGDDLDESRGSLHAPSLSAVQSTPKKLRPCPACASLLPFDTFSQHILQHHASDFVYLRINDRVVLADTSVEAFDNDRELQVTLPSETRSQVIISINGIEFQKAAMSGSGSLSHALRELRDGHMEIEVWAPGTYKKFIIIRGLQPPPNIPELDRVISRYQRNLHQGIEPNWDELSDAISEASQRAESERRYLRGFYTYTLAMWLDMRRPHHDNIRSHLEEAFTLLESFDTTLALSALGILAMRMNRFDALERCRSLTRLGLVTRFFVDSDLASLGALSEAPAYNPDRTLFVDTYLEVYLEAIQAYYSSDNLLLDRCLNQLGELVNERDSYDTAKYQLLQARTLLRLGQLEEASIFYRNLLNDPNFGNEARNQLI